jgi:hypothetical protein
MTLAKRKRSCHVLSREYKTLFPLCFPILGIAHVIFGLLKISFPNGEQPLIGRDVSVSLMMLIGIISALTGFTLYLHVIIKFLRGYTKLMGSTERVTKRLNSFGFYSWFIPLGGTVSGILPLIAIAYPSHSDEICRASLIGFSVTFFGTGLLVCNCLSFLIRELNIYVYSIEEHLRTEIQLVVSRLNSAYIAVAGGFFYNGTACLIFGSANFLFHITIYFMIFGFIVICPIGLAFVLTVSHDKANNSIVPTTSSSHSIEKNLFQSASNSSRNNLNNSLSNDLFN